MPKIKSKVKRFKQESAHRQTDGHTDATKRIISPATWSIKSHQGWVAPSTRNLSSA